MSNLVIDILHQIQKDLKVPKNKFNAFGKYKYRKCEDILEAAKAMLPAGCAIVITDTIEVHGEFNYVKATATILSMGESISASGFAKEAIDKKGMDPAQMTGTSSSYARKYALCGLLAIDDTEDADSLHGAENATKPAASPLTSLAAPPPPAAPEDPLKAAKFKFAEEAAPLKKEAEYLNSLVGSPEISSHEFSTLSSKSINNWFCLCHKYMQKYEGFIVPKQWAEGMHALLGLEKPISIKDGIIDYGTEKTVLANLIKGS